MNERVNRLIDPDYRIFMVQVIKKNVQITCSCLYSFVRSFVAGEHVDEAQKTRQGLAYKRRVNDSPNNSHNYKSLGHDNEQPMQQV